MTLVFDPCIEQMKISSLISLGYISLISNFVVASEFSYTKRKDAHVTIDAIETSSTQTSSTPSSVDSKLLDASMKAASVGNLASLELFYNTKDLIVIQLVQMDRLF